MRKNLMLKLSSLLRHEPAKIKCRLLWNNIDVNKFTVACVVR